MCTAAQRRSTGALAGRIMQPGNAAGVQGLGGTEPQRAPRRSSCQSCRVQQGPAWREWTRGGGVGSAPPRSQSRHAGRRARQRCAALRRTVNSKGRPRNRDSSWQPPRASLLPACAMAATFPVSAWSSCCSCRGENDAGRELLRRLRPLAPRRPAPSGSCTPPRCDKPSSTQSQCSCPTPRASKGCEKVGEQRHLLGRRAQIVRLQ